MFGANFLGFLTFFYIIGMVPAVVASLSVVAVPGVAFLLGMFILDEVMTIMDGIAFVLIAGALTTVLPKPLLNRNPLGKRHHGV
jgi:drug/metabolite transporter (DMT)-like permease